MHKRGSLLQKYTIHLIILALLLLLFMYATAQKSDTRYVKQQIVEKQIALLIDAALPGMEFSIQKQNLDGVIQEVKVEQGRVHVMVDGLHSTSGYRHLSMHTIIVEELNDAFVIKVQ